MASNYETLIIAVDYNKSFQHLDVQEIKNYYNWFLHIKHERLMKLGTYLFNRDYDFLSEENLKVVERFLFNSVGTVPMPKDEYDRAYDGMSERLRKVANVPDFLLDSKTITLQIVKADFSTIFEFIWNIDLCQMKSNLKTK